MKTTSSTEFEEKPTEPKSNLASMGIYVFTWQTLRKYLTEDEADPNSENDFGKNVIPAMLGNGEVMAPTASAATGRTWAPSSPLGRQYGYALPESGLDLLDESWPIYARSVNAPRPSWGQDPGCSQRIQPRQRH